VKSLNAMVVTLAAIGSGEKQDGGDLNHCCIEAV